MEKSTYLVNDIVKTGYLHAAEIRAIFLILQKSKMSNQINNLNIKPKMIKPLNKNVGGMSQDIVTGKYFK